MKYSQPWWLIVLCLCLASGVVLIEFIHPATTTTHRCHARAYGQLPDPQCTPGVTNPAVTQATIHRTICVPGWTATIRPPESYTGSLKRKQIIMYGYTDTNIHDYEEDHYISLELGGAPKDPRNLWPEYPRSPNPKDAVENRLRAKVCDGQMSLSAAQHIISTDWRQGE